MAPQEVAGLNAIAKAHGGSLTINPHTGLPEAGFLSSILPMIAGGLLAATGIGAPLAAAIVGGGTTIATGSLQKGLMAGLGAFGGAGIGQGLAASAAAAPTAAVTPATTLASEAAGTQAALAQNAATGIGVPSNAAAGVGNMSFAPGAAGPNMSSILGTPAPVAGPMSVPIGPQPTVALSPLEATQQSVLRTIAPEAVTAPAAAPITATGPASAPNLPTGTATPPAGPFDKISQGISNLGTEQGRTAFMGNAASKGVEAAGVGGQSGLLKYGTAAAAPAIAEYMKPKTEAPKKYTPMDYDFAYNRVEDPQAGYTGAYTGERMYFNPTFTRREAAGGGLMDIQAERYAEGGSSAVKPVEENPYYTMSGQSGDMFKYLMGQGAKPMPAAAPVTAPITVAAMEPKNKPVASLGDFFSSAFGLNLKPKATNTYTFDPNTGTFSKSSTGDDSGFSAPAPAPAPTQDFAANGGLMALAGGGASHLGDYSDGGRLLRGPGDGVSDSIPASIGDKRPARLADGEFVVPARIVSELGNGSTEAGARKLYAMMDRVQRARSKTVGKDRVAVNSRAEKMLPA